MPKKIVADVSLNTDERIAVIVACRTAPATDGFRHATMVRRVAQLLDIRQAEIDYANAANAWTQKFAGKVTPNRPHADDYRTFEVPAAIHVFVRKCFERIPHINHDHEAIALAGEKFGVRLEGLDDAHGLDMNNLDDTYRMKED